MFSLLVFQFSLDIQDIPDVNVETKKVLQGDSITNCLPLCVEISLKTVDGDQMILENWMLGVLPDQCDPSVKVTCTVYNRMSIMLKSLISVTRVTPAYKLSRRQGSDSYVIYYRIYMGEPQFHNLGQYFALVLKIMDYQRLFFHIDMYVFAHLGVSVVSHGSLLLHLQCSSTFIYIYICLRTCVCVWVGGWLAGLSLSLPYIY